MTEPFDERLAAFLRWHAADTAGAPSAIVVAQRIGMRQTRTRLGRRRLALVVATLLFAAAAIVGGAVIIGSRPGPMMLTNGGVVTFDGACGLLARPVGDGPTVHLLGDVRGCPSGGSRGDGAFAAVYYPTIVSSADGQTVLATRQVFCGGCGSIPTPEALAAQGVYLVHPDSGETRRLDDCRTERCGYYAAISPDGRSVAFLTWPYRAVTPGSAARGAVTIVHLDDGTETTIDDVDTGGLWFSQDGRKLAIGSITSTTDFSKPTTTVEVVGSDGSGRRTVATFEGTGQLAWSPDGRTLRLARDGIGDVETGRLTPSTIDFETGVIQPSTTFEADPGTARWSSDGRRLAYLVSDANGDRGRVMVIDREGASPRLVAGGSATESFSGPPIWSPDGRWLAVAGQMDVDGVSRSGIFAIEADGPGRRWLGPDDQVLAWLTGEPTSAASPSAAR